ncbi:hypothetical protein ACJX0J_029183, partial [Zea mays]
MTFVAEFFDVLFYRIILFTVVAAEGTICIDGQKFVGQRRSHAGLLPALQDLSHWLIKLDHVIIPISYVVFLYFETFFPIFWDWSLVVFGVYVPKKVRT